MTEQTGTTGGQPPPPDWYSKPPEWLTRPPQQSAPPPSQGHAQGPDLSGLQQAIEGMPERIVNALRDAVQAAQQQAGNQQNQTGQGQQEQQNKSGNNEQGVQQEEQRPGPLTFGERWFTK